MFKKPGNYEMDIKECLSHFITIDEVLKKKQYIDEEQYKHLLELKRMYIKKSIDEKIKNLMNNNERS